MSTGRESIISWLGVVVIVASISTPSNAGTFMKDRQTWEELSAGQKLAYVWGFNDGHFAITRPDEGGYTIDARRCVEEMEITDRTLVDLIEAGYRDVANWGLPANAMLFQGVRKMCLVRINGYRAERGEEPLKP